MNSASFKEYMSSIKNLDSLIGRKFRFFCDCMISIDVTGIVISYKNIKNERFLVVDVGGKYIQIGENHPNMLIFDV